MSKITNKDIARLAGVSPAAVSLAIHGKPGISEDTRARILKIAEERNYSSPVHSRVSSIQSITLLLDRTDHVLLPAVLRALLQLTQENGYEFQILSVQKFLENPENALKKSSILVTFDQLNREVLDKISALVPQILIIDGNFSRKPFWNVRIDYEGASYALARELANMGHRNFMYINGEMDASKNLMCVSGLQKLLLEQGLSLSAAQIVMNLDQDPHIWSHIPDIIHNFNVSIILCTSERTAVEVVNQLKTQGIDIPGEISIAAITDDLNLVHPNFSFTRIGLNYKGLAEELQRLILRGSDLSEYVDRLIPSTAIQYGTSTAPPIYNPAEKKLAIMLYLRNHPSLRIVRAGFLNKAQQLGYRAEVFSIEGDDNAAYCQALQELSARDVDGVVSWLTIPGSFDSFSVKNIPVVSLHSITQDTPWYGETARIAEDPKKIAAEVAEFFSDALMGQSGVLAVSQSGDNTLEASIIDELTKLMKKTCPKITVSHIFNFYGLDSTQQLEAYVRNTPELVGAFTTAGYACANWAAVKRLTGRDDLLIVGTDYSDESIQLVESGEIAAFIAQPLFEEGQSGVAVLDAVLRGKPFPRFSTLDAPLVTRDSLEKYRRLLQDVKNWYT